MSEKNFAKAAKVAKVFYNFFMQIKLASYTDSDKLLTLSKTYKSLRIKESQMIDLVNAILNNKAVPENITKEVLNEFISLCKEYKIKLIELD